MMKRYTVNTEWAGYSRGTAQYIVEAESEEEAMKNWWDGKQVSHVVVRDDTEGAAISAKETV